MEGDNLLRWTRCPLRGSKGWSCEKYWFMVGNPLGLDGSSNWINSGDGTPPEKIGLYHDFETPEKVSLPSWFNNGPLGPVSTYPFMRQHAQKMDAWPAGPAPCTFIVAPGRSRSDIRATVKNYVSWYGRLCKVANLRCNSQILTLCVLPVKVYPCRLTALAVAIGAF